MLMSSMPCYDVQAARLARKARNDRRRMIDLMYAARGRAK